MNRASPLAVERCRLLDELIAAWRDHGDTPVHRERRVEARAAVEAAWPTGAPLGWLYDWTHSSALGKPDEQFTGFTTDEAHARLHDNVRAVFTLPDGVVTGAPGQENT